MFSTMGLLLVGGGAALLGSLFEGSLAAAQSGGFLLALAAAGAFGLARRQAAVR